MVHRRHLIVGSSYISAVQQRLALVGKANGRQNTGEEKMKNGEMGSGDGRWQRVQNLEATIKMHHSTVCARVLASEMLQVLPRECHSTLIPVSLPLDVGSRTSVMGKTSTVVCLLLYHHYYLPNSSMLCWPIRCICLYSHPSTLNTAPVSLRVQRHDSSTMLRSAPSKSKNQGSCTRGRLDDAGND